jgi:hypothetical protein
VQTPPLGQHVGALSGPGCGAYPCFRSTPVVIVPLLRADTTISHLCKVPYRPERLQISHRNETLSSGAPLTSAMLGSNASHSGLRDVLCDF